MYRGDGAVVTIFTSLNAIERYIYDCYALPSAFAEFEHFKIN